VPTTTTTTTTTVPPSDDPPVEESSSEVPPTTVATDPPVEVISDDGPEDLFVLIGEPIPVEVDCGGEVVILLDGAAQPGSGQIESSALGIGDHMIEVRCDDATVVQVRAVVYEQDESAPAGSNMTVIVMFVMMGAGAFLFAPSAAGRRRLTL
jgi:hypothetical protein